MADEIPLCVGYMNIQEEKKRCIEELLAKGLIFIHVDLGNTEVVIPDFLRKEPALTLQISYTFQAPLNILEDRIEADLKFQGTYEHCVIPFESLWGVSLEESNEEYYWIEEMSETLMRHLLSRMLGGKRPEFPEEEKEVSKENGKKSKKDDSDQHGKGHLKLIK